MLSRTARSRSPPRGGVYSVSIRQYEPAWSSVTQVLMSQVPVPPPDTTSPPTAAAACEQHAHRALDQVGLRVAGLAHEVALVAHDAAHGRAPAARARSASRPASAGSQPQRGRPTLTSISTSGTCGLGGGGDRLVGVDRHRDAGHAALDERGEPVQVEALVGQQQVVAEPGGGHAHHLAHGGAAEPAVAGSASRAASAVDLNAFTCGRSAQPRPPLGHRGHVPVERMDVDQQRRRGQLVHLHGPEARRWCRRWDSNPHCLAPKASASAVGLRRRGPDATARRGSRRRR